jgi:hypothetical protein
MKPAYPYKPLSYWYTLIKLCTGEQVLYQNLDRSLQETIVRARYAAAWSGTIVSLLVFWTWFINHGLPLWLNGHGTIPIVLTVFTVILGVVGAGLIGYGLLRLYTLLAHNLTTNLFKVRGQRLRLLSVQTSLLSLVFPLALARGLATYHPTVGWLLIVLVCGYAVSLMARAYNYIFHLNGLRGLLVLCGGTLVTWFVLAIGALALCAAIGVIGFFGAVILRAFHHTS